MPFNIDLRHVRRLFRFYRHHSPYELQWARAYFGQHGEDVFLTEFFKGKQGGFYVDIGGFHPVQHSNTYSFYRSGWKGLIIEPNPAKHEAFIRHRARDVLVRKAVSDQVGIATFALAEEQSGITDQRYRYVSNIVHTNTIKVEVAPLESIFDDHRTVLPKLIDFMSVDCEGHDLAILRSNDWVRYRPRVVLCEAFGDDEERELQEFLFGQSYRFLVACGPTLIFKDAN